MNRCSLLVSAGLLLLVGFDLCAQQAVPNVETRDEKKVSHLRGWIFPGGEAGVILSVVTGAQDKIELSVASVGENLTPRSYRDVASGGVSLQLTDAQGNLLQSKSASLENRGFYTLVAGRGEGGWSLEVYADTPKASDNSYRPLRILNFTGQRDALIDLDAGKPMKVTAGSVAELRRPPKIQAGKVTVLRTDGNPPAESTVEVDLAVAPSCYLVLVPDHRGRMRPRLYVGGIPDVEENSSLSRSDAQR